MGGRDWTKKKNWESRRRKGRRSHTISVDTEGDDSEGELDSANRQIEIKSHDCWEVCDLCNSRCLEYLDPLKVKKEDEKKGTVRMVS